MTRRALYFLLMISLSGCAQEIGESEGIEPEGEGAFGIADASDAATDSNSYDGGVEEVDVSQVDPCLTLDCDDENSCTSNSCSKGACKTTVLSGTSCDDGDPCSVDNTCDFQGKCSPGVPLDCSDSSECTEEYCEPGVGCIAANMPNGFPCDDGNACSVGDECTLGVCTPGGELVCDDQNACTVLQGCDPLSGKCLFLDVPEGSACDDGNVCTLDDACVGGFCVPGLQEECDISGSCLQSVCNPKSGCMTFPLDGPCDDESPCTEGDTCSGGDCTGIQVSCDDDNPCTGDLCDMESGCAFNPLPGVCDDGSNCTQGDTCMEGACVAGEPVQCPAGPCEVTSCDPVSGDCIGVPSPDGTSCEDGNLCTEEDACFGGICGGIEVSCDDGEFCTTDTCDSGNGCEFTEESGALCTVEGVCGKGLCQEGTCVISEDELCDDENVCTTDFCNETLGCIFLTNPQTVCDDEVDCTFDTCLPDQGCLHSPVGSACDDGSPCVSFVCDVVEGCMAELQPNCCGNGLVEGTEICDDGNILPGDGCTPLCKGEFGSGYTDCISIKWAFPGAPSGIYSIDPDGDEGVLTPQKVWCEMNLDGGGWTLMAVVSDDGKPTWTGENFMLWQESTAIGAVTNLFSDYASVLRSVLLIEDLLFIHKPSGEWGAYRGIGNGLSPVTELFSPAAPPWCSGQIGSLSVPMTAGSLTANEGLCSTDLFLLQDSQGNTDECGQSQVAYGPAWWIAAEGEVCEENDPVSLLLSGLGMSPITPSEELQDLGFGGVLGLNQGNPEQGQNAMWVLIRSGLCGDGIVSGSETCDDGGLEPGDGCSELCTVEEP